MASIAQSAIAQSAIAQSAIAQSAIAQSAIAQLYSNIYNLCNNLINFLKLKLDPFVIHDVECIALNIHEFYEKMDKVEEQYKNYFRQMFIQLDETPCKIEDTDKLVEEIYIPLPPNLLDILNKLLAKFYIISTLKARIEYSRLSEKKKIRLKLIYLKNIDEFRIAIIYTLFNMTTKFQTYAYFLRQFIINDILPYEGLIDDASVMMDFEPLKLLDLFIECNITDNPKQINLFIIGLMQFMDFNILFGHLKSKNIYIPYTILLKIKNKITQSSSSLQLSKNTFDCISEEIDRQFSQIKDLILYANKSMPPEIADIIIKYTH